MLGRVIERRSCLAGVLRANALVPVLVAGGLLVDGSIWDLDGIAAMVFVIAFWFLLAGWVRERPGLAPLAAGVSLLAPAVSAVPFLVGWTSSLLYSIADEALLAMLIGSAPPAIAGVALGLLARRSASRPSGG